jgi:hypothetical protein
MQRSLCILVLATLGMASSARAQLPATHTADFTPDPASVQRYGPAYRFPQAGWIVVHIEGEPYERGYQHGRLLAAEIAGYLRCFAAVRGSKAPAEAWAQTRTLANALFLRRFDREYLEEMKGIADGASAAGGRFEQRPIDLVDIVAMNCWPEIDFLDPALAATPTGLESIRFPKAEPRAMPKRPDDHCSAFAATGPATADGKIVFGHITMFGLYPANFYNVWLDIKPAKGQRMLMCGYPGAIQSGMDYYMNDAGILIAETTISQTRFDIQGQAEASRIRKAIQYARTIDQAVDVLKTGNNGLYTNEWLLADINTNEIALFELGTHRSKLHRSSKNEWIGGTTGFYWGCNNTKDLEVRLETVASVHGRPANVVFHPSDRDRVWQQLYHKHKGKIGVAFGKEAFTTPPLAAYHSLDAKFTTTDLAKQLKSWALYGPPLGRTWQPTLDERRRYPEIKPLVSNPWTILNANAPPKAGDKLAAAVDLDSLRKDAAATPGKALLPPPAWHGTLLPATDADIWLATAFADYERIYAQEQKMRKDNKKGELTAADKEKLAVDLFAYRSSYLSAARASGDVPLSQIKSDIASDAWYRIAAGKGVLLLHELRQTLGDTAFEKAMDSFGRDNAGKRVTTAGFQAHVEKSSGKHLASLFDTWHKHAGLPSARLYKADTRFARDEVASGKGRDKVSATNGAVFSILSFYSELERTLIVYGSGDEVPTNREAAEALQKAIRERWSNITVPCKSEREVSEGDLKAHHLLLIGRPDSNTLVERFKAALPISFGSRSFLVRGKTYAHPGSAVMAAADNPLNKRYSLVTIAGLGPLATLEAAPKLMRGGFRQAQVVVLPNGGSAQELVLWE